MNSAIHHKIRLIGPRGLIPILLGIVAAVSPLAAHAEEILRIAGTGSALGSMKIMGRAFEKAHPGIRVKVLPSIGSSGGIRGVAEGAVDIGLSSRPLKEREQTQTMSALLYAKTPFMPVANRSVKTAGLKTEELVQIYRGKLEKWTDGRKIRVILRPPSDTDTELLKKVSPGMKAAVEGALCKPGTRIATTDQDCAERIEKTPGALGFLSLTQVTTEKRHVRVLSFNGVTPSLKSIAKGTYPLVKPLYLVTKSRQPEKVLKFISFVRSSQGRKLLEKTGNLPVLRGTRG